MAKPNLALIPATIGDKVYSILPSDGVGDFDFTRGSEATRINAQGLIETVASGENRLNYPLIDGVVQGCPSLLLENSATNLVTYSEDFSNAYWNKTRGDITSNALISPDGTLSADLFTAENDSTAYVQNNVSITVSGSKQSISLFVKKGSTNWCYLLLWDSTANGSYQYFDIENGVVGDEDTFGSGVTVDTANIEKYPNDWYRISVTYNCSITNLRARISQTNGNLDVLSETGATIYIWGFQAEANSSYITSYIPTTSATVTRSAETCNNSGDANTFNDSEGVLMAEISALSDDGTNRMVSLSDGSTNNRVLIKYDNIANRLEFFVFRGGSSQYTLIETSLITTFNNKILFKYKENDFSVWANGFELDNNTSGNTPIGLSELAFDDGSGANDFYGNTKQIQYFDTALTDTDLEELTSWTSFNEMATGQLYTIQ